MRLFGDKLAAFTFWGWQTVILAAAITLPLGITTSKEYAELEWPIDLLITVVWVPYAVVFFGTIAKRRVKHIYVANWFYAAFIITVAILHIVNSLAIPVDAFKSYSVYSGVVYVFFWAVRAGQFDDLDTPAWSVVLDDDTKPPGTNSESSETEARDIAENK